MQDDNFNKTPHILLLFWPQFFTKIFTGKMILPMVLPVNQWYGKFSKFSSLPVVNLLLYFLYFLAKYALHIIIITFRIHIHIAN